MAERDPATLKQLAKLVRYFILVSTTQAGSGHLSSSMSAVELMVTLLFGDFFRFDLDNPDYPNNDRLIFSKGHAAPLLYALYGAAGRLTEDELKELRVFGSPLEGHPTTAFRYTEAATGSLGQGLPIGVGMALNAKLEALPYRTYVLLGDSEMSEGSQWEAMQIAAHYKLDNLIGVLDVNRLGQRGETMYGHDLGAYEQRAKAFGWRTVVVSDGHSFASIEKGYRSALSASTGKPTMIIARTVKGKGVSLVENKNGWHGKALSPKQLSRVLKELGMIDAAVRGDVAKPKLKIQNYPPKSRLAKGGKSQINQKISKLKYKKGELVATRKAYGTALTRIYSKYPNIVALDGEVSNSTFSEIFQKAHPDRFFEMYVAEQNMAGAALGLSRRGKIPFVSTFAAFLTRAFDQIRMSQYSDANIKFVGSHAGVSIGEDGVSQMGLEDLAMFRTLLNSVVLYPADAVATERLVEQAASHHGNVYIRTTRKDTPVLYDKDDPFSIGGSKVLRSSRSDVVTIIAAGITVFEALKAHDDLKRQSIAIRVIDLYSIKPLDLQTLRTAAAQTQAIVTVEDHYAEGGIGEAVAAALADQKIPVYRLAVRKMPRSGKPDQLLDYEDISARAIMEQVKALL